MKFWQREESAPEAPAVRTPTTHELAAIKVRRFDALCAEVVRRGAHFPRDFGHWVRLRLDGDRFLELDSYGHNLGIKRGTGEYGSHGFYAGFDGAKIKYLGTHFGAPSIYATDDELTELEAAVAAAPDQHTQGHPRLTQNAS